jgi:hypothetical protein
VHGRLRGRPEAGLHAPGRRCALDAPGVFDDAYKALVIQADGEPAIAAVDPVIGVQVELWPVQPLKGGTILIPRTGVTYMVADVQPDGHGWAKLLLTQYLP